MFTDFLGNPINEGDTIIYPDQRGVLNISVVHKLVPLVPHHSPYAAHPALMREDQANKADPTRFSTRDPFKRYVIQVLRPNSWPSSHARYATRKYTLPTLHAVVVPPGSTPR